MFWQNTQSICPSHDLRWVNTTSTCISSNSLFLVLISSNLVNRVPRCKQKQRSGWDNPFNHNSNPHRCFILNTDMQFISGSQAPQAGFSGLVTWLQSTEASTRIVALSRNLALVPDETSVELREEKGILSQQERSAAWQVIQIWLASGKSGLSRLHWSTYWESFC